MQLRSANAIGDPAAGETKQTFYLLIAAELSFCLCVRRRCNAKRYRSGYSRAMEQKKTLRDQGVLGEMQLRKRDAGGESARWE